MSVFSVGDIIKSFGDNMVYIVLGITNNCTIKAIPITMIDTAIRNNDIEKYILPINIVYLENYYKLTNLDNLNLIHGIIQKGGE